MKIVLFILLLIAAAPVIGFAQIDDLMNDPDVVWIGEIELEYNFSPEKLNGEYFPEFERRYNYRVRKSDFDYCDYPISLIAGIFEGINEKKFSIYDKPKGKKLTDEEVEQKLAPRLDTIRLITPYNYEERYQIVSSCEPVSNLIKSYLVRQVWYYHVKKKQFSNRTIGVSLMLPVNKQNANSDSTEQAKEILFYVEFPNITDPALQVNSPNVPFCMETTEAIDFSMFKVLKGNSHKTFEQLFFHLPKEQKIDVFSVESGYCCNKVVDKEEHYQIFEHTVDTVIVFHPITYAELMKIKENQALSFKDYNDNYRLKQTWYFDSKSHQLVSELNSIAPTKAVYDENGNFLYDHAIFYLCFSQNATAKDKRR